MLISWKPAHLQSRRLKSATALALNFAYAVNWWGPCFNTSISDTKFIAATGSRLTSQRVQRSFSALISPKSPPSLTGSTNRTLFYTKPLPYWMTGPTLKMKKTRIERPSLSSYMLIFTLTRPSSLHV